MQIGEISTVMAQQSPCQPNKPDPTAMTSINHHNNNIHTAHPTTTTTTTTSKIANTQLQQWKTHSGSQKKAPVPANRMTTMKAASKGGRNKVQSDEEMEGEH